MMVAFSSSSTHQHGCPLGRHPGEGTAPVPDELAERYLGARRNDQRRHGFEHRRRFVSTRRAGEDDMGVGPAETKGIDPSKASLARRRDRLRTTYQPEVQGVERYVRVRRLTVQCWRHDTPIEGDR